jgi:hypothetical protein
MPALLVLATRVVRIAGLLVPIARRVDWVQEWRAELWHHHHSLRAGGRLSVRDQAAFVLRSAGSIFDALQFRVGDAETWSESISTVAARWRRNTPAVTIALFVLSLGMAADALLIAFGRLTVEAPRSGWNGLPTEMRSPIVGIAIVCGASLIVASAALATRLFGTVDTSDRRVHNSAWVVDTLLVACGTAWLAGWFAVFGVRSMIPEHARGWLTSVDLAAAVTSACIMSWLAGLTILTVLRVPRRRQAPR